MLTEAHIQTMLKSVGAGSGLVMPAADIARAFNDAIINYGSGLFTTVDSVAAFVSECMMESAYFRTTEEYSKTGSYAPYIGRTFIQLTWKSNYQKFGKWCYEQGLVSDANYFVNNPKALADLKWAALGGVWYFTKVMFDGKPLTTYSSNIDQIGKAVNLGSPYSSYTPNGQTARRTAYAAVKALGPSIIPTKSSIVPVETKPVVKEPILLSTTKRVRWKNTSHYVDERTHAQLSQVEANLKYPIKMYQGSWANGSLSASTHSGSGAADIGPTGPITWRQLETECRKVGLMAFFRPWANNYHVHVGSIGNSNVAYWLGVQIKAYLAGYDGLGATARASRDTGNRSYLNVRWENYAGRVVASTASSEEDVLKWMKFVTSKVQKLAKADKYQYVKFNDKGDVSFATGPCQLVGGVLNLRFKNLPVGMSAYVRIVEDDVDSEGKTKRAYTLGELVEVQGSTGITWVSIPFNGNPGSKKGYTRRIRVEWSAPSDKVEIVRASVAYFRN